MDGRDPPEPPPPPRPPPEEEEEEGRRSAAAAAAAAMAKEAAALFQGRRYTECIDVLKQLLLRKEGDPKVLHNIAVAEYFRDGCPDPKKLLDVLEKVKKRSEELARVSGEHTEAVKSLGSNGTVQYAEVFDTSIMTFNTAVILYHLHDYAHALSVLEPLFQNIGPIEETTAFHICLLLLDTALSSQDAKKALDIIQYLEKFFGIGSMTTQNDNGSATQHQSLNLVRSPLRVNNSSAPDASALDSITPENPTIGNLSDDALEYETLYSTLDSGGHQKLERPFSNDLSKPSSDSASTTADLKLKLQLFKVRLLLLTRNLKVAKRELKLAMNMARGRDSSTELLLKSQLEYARGNHRKAIKLLEAPNNRTEPAMATIFNNNLGCIYHQQRSHHISSWFFSKALRNCLSFRLEKPMSLVTFSKDKSRLISYNCGLENLACGKPLLAASCFREALPLFYNQPLFWLRFAECSLLALKMGLLSSAGASSGDEEVKVLVVGSGKWRQVVINPLSSRKNRSDSTEKNRGWISLPYARQCLCNALLLLDSFEKETAKDSTLDSTSEANSNAKTDSKASNTTSTPTTANSNGDPKGGLLNSNATLQSSVALYEEFRQKENYYVKQAVLGDLAYIELSLENPVKALSAAKSLQDLPYCSRIYIFLSHVYAAEALCQLNRPKEAAEQLSTYIIDDGKDVKLPYQDEDLENCFLEKLGEREDSNGLEVFRKSQEGLQDLGFLKPEEARGVLYVNFATMFALQGDLERASFFAKQGLVSLSDNPKVLLTSIYVDLLQGKAHEALTKLRQWRHVTFVRQSSSTVSS
ncbi:CCR4-NOT transcription complex subunit 10 [Ananas comosus]|uniref:CCR4-NOT transcription complex subunit 10 n=1 Tax=Ananas comosus TaxID=4615 RepID=A0A199UQD9_ANACO|nr:CCR4-NOT transcription complex subunit 10 [Ananas comosus]